MSRRCFLVLFPFLLARVLPVGAQNTPIGSVPLETFVQQVTHLWNQGDVSGLMELAPEHGRVVLDTGSGTETVHSRHAAAALRALFSGRESASSRPVRITLAGGSPPRGFAELAWTFRTRGAPGTQTRSVYIGALWESNGWRVSELRILP